MKNSQMECITTYKANSVTSRHYYVYTEHGGLYLTQKVAYNQNKKSLYIPF